MPIVPAPFLFRFTLPVERVEPLPRAQAPCLELPASCRVPFPSSLEGGRAFAELRLAWNPRGLALSVEVSGKTARPQCRPDAPLSADGVQVWIDTRDMQTVHRATRFCHQFVLLPMGGGEDGQDPVCRQLPVPRAREDAPEIDPELLLLESHVRQGGYRQAVWFPAESLQGFDPGSNSRLGFYLCVNDRELGRQFLSVGDEFPCDGDPSLWVSLELVSKCLRSKPGHGFRKTR